MNPINLKFCTSLKTLQWPLKKTTSAKIINVCNLVQKEQFFAISINHLPILMSQKNNISFNPNIN